MTFSLYSDTKSTSCLNSGFIFDKLLILSFSFSSYEYKERLVMIFMHQSKFWINFDWSLDKFNMNFLIWRSIIRTFSHGVVIMLEYSLLDDVFFLFGDIFLFVELIFNLFFYLTKLLIKLFIYFVLYIFLIILFFY